VLVFPLSDDGIMEMMLTVVNDIVASGHN